MSDRAYSFEKPDPDDVPFASPEEAEAYMQSLLTPLRDYYDNNCTADEMSGGRWEE